MNLMAEDEGFEPPQTESESGVLPLHKSSVCNAYIICTILKKSTLFRTFFFPGEGFSGKYHFFQIAEGLLLSPIRQHGQ